MVIELENFDALEVSENKIVLKNADDIPKIYNLIKDSQNFILNFEEEGETISKLIYAGDMESKINNRDLELLSKKQK